MIFPNNNLPTASKYWAREIEKYISNLDSSFKSAEINNVTRDSQLIVTATNALTAATDAQQAASQAQAAADAASQAVIDAATAQLSADNAQDDATAAALAAANAAQAAADAAQVGSDAAQAAADAAQAAADAAQAASDANGVAIEANGVAIEALELAQAQQIEIDTAQDDAIAALQGLGSLDEATSTYKINASNVTVGTLNADLITAGTLSADRIGGGVINGVGNITSGGTIFATVNLGAGGNLGLNGSIFMGGLIDCDGSITGGSFSTSGDSTLSGRISSTGTYGATTTSTANLFVASNGNFARSTSSRRYKADIQSIDYGMKALELEPRTWVDIAEYRDNGNSPEGLERIPGFIAEELDELGLTELVQYNEDGQPDAVYYDRMLVAVMPVIKNQQQIIEQLTARIEALESR